MTSFLPGALLGGGAGGLSTARARPRRDFRQHVGLAQNQNLVGSKFDLGAAVLGKDDLVALSDVHFDALPILVSRTRADRQHLAALRLLFGSVRQDDPAYRRLLLLEHLDDQSVAKWLQIHESLPEQFLESVSD